MSVARLAVAAASTLAIVGLPGRAAESDGLELKLSYELQSVRADPGALARFVPLEVSINGARVDPYSLLKVSFEPAPAPVSTR